MLPSSAMPSAEHVGPFVGVATKSPAILSVTPAPVVQPRKSQKWWAVLWGAYREVTSEAVSFVM